MKYLFQFSVFSLFFLLTFSGCGKDACEEITCINGACVNGECSCEEGWRGPGCSQQKAPININVTKFEVTSFPETKSNGNVWDADGSPDIYLTLEKESSGEMLYQSAFPINEAAHDTTYLFEPSGQLKLAFPQDQYLIVLMDYDDDSEDDRMARVSFTPYSPTNSFPSVLHLEAGEDFTVEVHITYSFD